MLSLKKELTNLEEQIGFLASCETGDTIIGLVSPDGDLVKCLQKQSGHWVEVDDEPQAYFPEKLEKVFTNPKRFIILIGGRGSGKSLSIADLACVEMHDEGLSWMCLREFQSSISDSVHSLIKDETKRLELDKFNVTDTTISSRAGGRARFAGIARNPESIKSAAGFNTFWSEEAQSLSEDSLKTLTPTARNKATKGLPNKLEEVEEVNALEKSRLIFTANPGSSEDPFSKRFINPFKTELDSKGYYEDDLHLIIKVNWSDNPWFAQSGLEEERLWDYNNLPRALYDHIWEGEFNDSVEGALIMSEWFDACIDADIKLGFKEQGAIFAAHDPSDVGPDSKGFAVRHGSVITEVLEKTEGTIHDGCDWATGLAIQYKADYYTWDCDGMGVGLARDTEKALRAKCHIETFKGSESPDRPGAIYQPVDGVKQPRKIEDVFRNKRAQYYSELRDRVYRTYRAIVHGEYSDPDKMISFRSSMDSLKKLRAELCRMPVKPNANGYIELYTKEEMKRKFKFASPNLADSVMMLMRSNNATISKQVYIPKPIPVMGRR